MCDLRTVSHNPRWTGRLSSRMGLRGRELMHFVKHLQGGGSIMFLAEIIGNELVGPYRVEDGLKMNSQDLL